VAALAEIVLLKNSLRCDANKGLIENSTAKFFCMRDIWRLTFPLYFSPAQSKFILFGTEQHKKAPSIRLLSSISQGETFVAIFV
jgi:hypothetical protein